jgi:hypothetical protein
VAAWKQSSLQSRTDVTNPKKCYELKDILQGTYEMNRGKVFEEGYLSCTLARSCEIDRFESWSQDPLTGSVVGYASFDCLFVFMNGFAFKGDVHPL